MGRPVLLSWLALHNDPYERDPKTLEYRLSAAGGTVPGPTLNLLASSDSPYQGRCEHAIFVIQLGRNAERGKRVYAELAKELRALVPGMKLEASTFDGPDPTDHEAIFRFVRELLPRLRTRFPDRELLIHLSPGTPAMQTVWLLMGATGFITEPFTLVKTVPPSERSPGAPSAVPVHLELDTFLRRYSQSQASRVASPDQGIVWNPARFRSPRLTALYAEAQRVARLRTPVLILGERGTGKTTLAGWVRMRSPFRNPKLDRGWPAVPCGQYTAEMMRAELFGYERGAFTGAVGRHQGLLGLAHRDSLFLDEVGDLTRDLQRLLIKAVEEGRYQPVGSTEYEESNFRLITATNVPLHELKLRLDQDFFDRISVFTLQVPPLREIREEIDWLWDEILRGVAQRAGVDARLTLTDDASRARVVDALRRHELPGNLRSVAKAAAHFLAVRAEDDRDAAVSDAVEAAIAALESGSAEPMPVSRSLARAFASGDTLPEDLLDRGPIDVKAFETDWKGWLAQEAFALARRRRLPIERIVNVTDRSLRDWRKGGSGGPEE